MTAGMNQDAFTQQARADASRGLREEGVLTILPGSFLFKFVQRADIPDEIALLSPWWFQESAIRKILVKARDHRTDERVMLNSSIAQQACEDAGLSSTWKNCGANYILVGKVINQLKVIWGAPKPVGMQSAHSAAVSTGLEHRSDVDSIEIIPNPQCVQFYVPGMRNPTMARKCIVPRGKFKFTHSPELAAGRIEEFLLKIKGEV